MGGMQGAIGGAVHMLRLRLACTRSSLDRVRAGGTTRWFLPGMPLWPRTGGMLPYTEEWS